MAADGSHAWIAADVGNSRIKLGCFCGTPGVPLPEPVSTLDIAADRWEPARLAQWLRRELPPTDRAARPWQIASVNTPASDQLRAWLQQQQLAARIHLLQAADLPLAIDVSHPQQVGLDRLLAAVAANQLRQPAEPAITVDLGTAVTVDWISSDGHFQGGAIAPGIAMGAHALHEMTDRLPHVVPDPHAKPPPPLGRDTDSAIQSGLFWGTVGTIRELVTRLTRHEGGTPVVFVTGGGSPRMAELVDPAARWVPHLVLAGIAVAQARRQ